MEQQEDPWAQLRLEIPMGVLTVCLFTCLRDVPFTEAYIVTLLCVVDCYFMYRDFTYLFALCLFGTYGLLSTYLSITTLHAVLFVATDVIWWIISYFDHYGIPCSIIINYWALVVLNRCSTVPLGKMYIMIFESHIVKRYIVDFRQKSWLDLLLLLSLHFIVRATIEEKDSAWNLFTAYAIFLFWAYYHSRTFRNSNSD